MAVLGRLHERGLEIGVNGDRIRYRPASAMTPDLAEDVVRLKPELLKLLAGQTDREQVVQRLTARTVTTRVVVLRRLPLILDWMGKSAPNLFHNQEQNGLNLAGTWDSYVLGLADRPTLERALELWVGDLERGSKLYLERLGVVFGHAPIWSFWTCYSVQGRPESGLSRFLREDVGYPTDKEAGMASRMGGSDA